MNASLQSAKGERTSSFQVDVNQLSVPQWYVIHTLPNHEFVVERILQKKNFTIFLPATKELSQRKDRKKILEVPLFRGYMFINTALWPKEIYDIMSTQGVYRILGINGRFAHVEDEVIDSIKLMVTSGRALYPYDNLAIGDKVRITEGPLEGAVGVIIRRREKQRRLVVSLKLMNLAVAVELGNEAVKQTD